MRRSLLLWLLVLSLFSHVATADQPLRIGLFPRMSHERMVRMFQPLGDWLAERLGREVVIESAADFPSFWNKVRKGRYDLIHYNQYHYIKAHHQLRHRVIARNQELGKDTIRAAIVVPAKSQVRDVGQLYGARVLFGGGRSAMVSYIMAHDLLQQQGLAPGDYLARFALTPVDAVRYMYYGQADAAGAGDTLLRLDDMPWDKGAGAPRVIALSQPVAQLPWAVAAHVDEVLARQLRDALLALQDDPRGRHILRHAKLTGIVAASDADYDEVRRIVARTLHEAY